MEEYLSYIKTDKYKELPDPLAIDDIQNSVKEDKTFSHFKERVSQEPQQVSYLNHHYIVYIFVVRY